MMAYGDGPVFNDEGVLTGNELNLQTASEDLALAIELCPSQANKYLLIRCLLLQKRYDDNNPHFSSVCVTSLYVQLGRGIMLPGARNQRRSS